MPATAVMACDVPKPAARSSVAAGAALVSDVLITPPVGALAPKWGVPSDQAAFTLMTRASTQEYLAILGWFSE